MRKTLKALLIVGSLGALCAGLAACSNQTKIDEYFKEGNVIMVTYDGSGGEILSSNQVSIVDMFNPDKYTADEDGYIHIKLRDPTTRPSTVGDISVLRRGYSLVGWYQKRETVEVDGSVVDDDGNKLIERNGQYYKVTVAPDGTKREDEAVPAYTYSDPWDFATDTVDFKKGDEKLEMTLYAGWMPFLSFEYYYQETGKSEWTKFKTTTFDYLISQKENAKEDSDPTKVVYDSVFVPEWSTETGRMEHKYSNVYTFPSIEKMTFNAAYTDEACLNQITREHPYKHTGSLNYATAAAIDPVQKVYVKFDKGSRYRISNAQQFSDIGDPDGIYTILADELDFNCKLDEDGELTFTSTNGNIRWPISLMLEKFTGSIEGENGKKVTFKNIGAQYDNSAQVGGLFGTIANSAVIKNVSFENVIFDIKSATSRRGAYFGMFAGNIEEKATLEHITVSGQMRLWSMSISPKDDFHFNLIANKEQTGENGQVTVRGVTSADGVNRGKVKLIVCGSLYTKDKFYFSDIDPDQVTVDKESGNISLGNPPTSAQQREKSEQFYTKFEGDES